jgi:hypothetical protein
MRKGSGPDVEGNRLIYSGFEIFLDRFQPQWGMASALPRSTRIGQSRRSFPALSERMGSPAEAALGSSRLSATERKGVAKAGQPLALTRHLRLASVRDCSMTSRSRLFCSSRGTTLMSPNNHWYLSGECRGSSLSKCFAIYDIPSLLRLSLDGHCPRGLHIVMPPNEERRIVLLIGELGE